MTSCSLFALAFRPFFLFGSLYATLGILYWALYHLNLVMLPSYFDSTSLHVHEMLFGFITAILSGFLLTASRNWASTRGVHGKLLFLLVLTWFLGRLAIGFSNFIPPKVTALVDLSYLPFLCFLLWQTLAKGAKKVNFVFVFLLVILFISNLMMHLEVLEITTGTSRTGYLLGVNTLIVIMTVISGRVIPMFTQNAIQGITVKKLPWLEKVVIASAVGFLLSNLWDEASLFTDGLAVLCGLVSLIRLSFWKPFQTVERPILWVLHLGYAFLGVGLIARGLSFSVFQIKTSIALHLITAGAMGLLVIGMISRVSLGHTGRPLIVSKPMVFAYCLVALGALIRVLIPIAFPSAYIEGIVTAALLWALGFAVFTFSYYSILASPRVDGIEG